jgi:uncharacterized membrane protein YphA (DoxX/SURF4 family)
MNKPLLMKIITWACRLIVGGVFICVGIVKIIDPVTFAKDIGNYQLMPHITINLLAITMPWIEVVAGLLLVCGVWMRPSALVIGVLLLIFIAAIGQAMARGFNIECGCGTGAQKVGWKKVGENVVFLGMIAWLWWRTKTKKGD